MKSNDQIKPLLTQLNSCLTTETGSPPSAQLVFSGGSKAHVFYSPSIEEQKSLGGLNADFVIKYNVILTDLIGDVQVIKVPYLYFTLPIDVSTPHKHKYTVGSEARILKQTQYNDNNKVLK